MSPDSPRLLAECEPGSAWVVFEVRLPPKSRARLMELGLLEGTRLELVRFAPWGDPVELKLRGSRLTLPKEEAEHIFVVADKG
ncbi:MAG TPA: FeoA family protein [Candidatus Paceibacterota bacterium]|nr:FeoA family protein [Verrucomicrobiota bacterium]HRY46499.1 FeoA family protein [Candidatus Paceibacterota bacterium]HSA02984.1 FeoA family protein [Candidatus Paceibacterota bacterium]